MYCGCFTLKVNTSSAHQPAGFVTLPCSLCQWMNMEQLKTNQQWKLVWKEIWEICFKKTNRSEAHLVVFSSYFHSFHHSPCSFLNSFSVRKTGLISSPTGGWMDTKNFLVWVLKEANNTGKNKNLAGRELQTQDWILPLVASLLWRKGAFGKQTHQSWKFAACVESQKSMPITAVAVSPAGSSSDRAQQQQIIRSGSNIIAEMHRHPSQPSKLVYADYYFFDLRPLGVFDTFLITFRWAVVDSVTRLIGPQLAGSHAKCMLNGKANCTNVAFSSAFTLPQSALQNLSFSHSHSHIHTPMGGCSQCNTLPDPLGAI